MNIVWLDAELLYSLLGRMPSSSSATTKLKSMIDLFVKGKITLSNLIKVPRIILFS